MKAVPWWSSDLTVLRRQTMKAREELGRIRKENKADQKLNAITTYRDLRNKYKNEIRNCKLKTWQNFVAEIGNTDPWGIVYKILRNKIRNNDISCDRNRNRN
ncbi:unnamed protein product [Lasius platythorax]|uniref:Reverse transcriptase N-terminal domain-containing protein n=1 Tax=Lasius platythorax TaxID=488582 RepID=A0AAV2N0T6_9HYME